MQFGLINSVYLRVELRESLWNISGLNSPTPRFYGPPALQSQLEKALTLIVSLLAYIIALWLGTILGLSGTLWN
jgi:hypothetical protein